MTETTTTSNTRPESLDDLTDWDRRGKHVATITAEPFLTYPSLGQHLLAAIAEAEHLGLAVAGGEILIPLTDDELQKKLESKQRSWDHDQETYRKALAGEPVEQWRRTSIDNWARNEGLDPVNWDEVPVR